MTDASSASSRTGRPAEMTACALLTAALGYADYLTGAEIAFTLLYLIPISWAAWRRDVIAGLAISALATAEWFLVDSLLRVQYRHPAVRYWNGLVELGVFVSVVLLLSAVRRQLSRAESLARTDTLTGLLNRRAFLETGALELARARRFGQPVTLAFLDVDDFKTINDGFGHAAGDVVLATLARVVRLRLRAFDAAARWGGDELAILMISDEPGALVTLQDLQERVALDPDLQRYRVRMTVGAVTFQHAPLDLAFALAEADARMYDAKRTGKGQLNHESLARAV
jgi:diguanylate cyclase (GGDEF)-like protein